jgi:hypothetical protein
MRQPSGSKIQLTSKADRLQLTIPARFRPDREDRHQLVMTGLADLGSLILIALTIYLLISINGNTDVGVKIGFCVGLMFVMPLTYWLLRTGLHLSFDLADKFLSHTLVKIDRKQFTLSVHLYGLDRGRPKQLKTTEISQVIIDNYQHPDLKVPKVSLLLELRQTDPIRIFSTGQDLTKREIEWLARELSNWLGINLINGSIDFDN